MPTGLIICLIIGTIAMILVSLLRCDFYGFSYLKAVAAMIFSTFAGIVGIYVLFYLENGYWGGQSFFGAVLIAPIVLIIASLVLKIPYGKLMDFCAPAECAMLFCAKIHCAIVGCCDGRVICSLNNGNSIVFPSALIESVCGVLLLILLLRIEKQGNNKNCLYPWYMIFYGALRFVLNCFRDNLVPYVWILPAGHFWSLVTCLIGSVLIIYIHKKGKNTWTKA